MCFSGGEETAEFDLFGEAYPVPQHLRIVSLSFGPDCRSALFDTESVVYLGAFKMFWCALKPRSIQAPHELMRLVSLLLPLPAQNCMHELV